MTYSFFGLTGGIASGKSTVAGYFADLGAHVIDSDDVAHELLRLPGPVFDAVVQAFGGEILDEAGAIDRRKLGAIVFAGRAKLRQLNALMHPAIIERINHVAADLHRQKPGAPVIVDAALIFEAGIDAMFRKVIVAWCRPEQQLERLISKGGLSRDQAESRIAAQMSADEKRRRGDFVVDCSGTLDETRAQVGVIYAQLKRLAQQGNAPETP
ncbi:MAG: dephospho-CoA kinase [Terriglobia bacterium]